MSSSELLDFLNAEHKRIHSRLMTTRRDDGSLVTRRIKKEDPGVGPMRLSAISVHNLMRPPDKKKIKIKGIQELVARHFNVSREDILSARRTANVMLPRHIAMYLSKLLTLRSLPEIGRRFGNRDHTTVLNAVRKITGLVTADPALAAEIELLKEMLVRTMSEHKR